MFFTQDLLKGVIIGIIVMFIFYRLSENCFLKSDAQALADQATQILARQAARWATAAEQDESLLIQVLHANYGAGYLWALQDLGGAKNFKRVTGGDWDKFVQEVIRVQDNATKRLISTCPDFGPDETPLTLIGKE